MYKMRGLVTVSLAVLGVAGAQAVLIDDFSTGPYSITSNSIIPTTEAVRLGSMLGGERDAMLRYLSGPQSVTASVVIGGGGVQFFSEQSETNGSLFLQYDGLDGELEIDGVQTPGTGLGGNFTGSSAFVFDFNFVDAGLGANIQIMTTVVSNTGTASFTSNVANGGGIVHTQNFSNFAGVNFANVQSVTFQFVTPMASDFTLNSISTGIPGPAAFAPFLVGIATLLKRRKKI